MAFCAIHVLHSLPFHAIAYPESICGQPFFCCRVLLESNRSHKLHVTRVRIGRARGGQLLSFNVEPQRLLRVESPIGRVTGREKSVLSISWRRKDLL